MSRSFPKLMVSEAGRIVKFSAPGVGELIAIDVNNSNYFYARPVGSYSRNWDMNVFTDYQDPNTWLNAL